MKVDKDYEEKCAEKAYAAQICDQNQLNQQMTGVPPNFSLREQAERNANHHARQADYQLRVAAFFQQNPAFEEFIQLVRSGAISIW